MKQKPCKLCELHQKVVVDSNRYTGDTVAKLENNELLISYDSEEAWTGMKATYCPLCGKRIAVPLIESVDARYITKLWAKANLIPSNSAEIEVCHIDGHRGKLTQLYADGIYIQFWGRIAPDTIHGKCYSIDELCGKEEE